MKRLSWAIFQGKRSILGDYRWRSCNKWLKLTSRSRLRLFLALHFPARNLDLLGMVWTRENKPNRDLPWPGRKYKHIQTNEGDAFSRDCPTKTTISSQVGGLSAISCPDPCPTHWIFLRVTNQNPCVLRLFFEGYEMLVVHIATTRWKDNIL